MICKQCNNDKEYSEFYTNTSSKSGYRGECKECSKENANKRYRTEDGIITSIYANQLKSSRTRGHYKPKYTRDELSEWIKSQKNWISIYSNWKDSGYKSELSPTCDRLDDYKGYSFDNIKLCTWKENQEHNHSNKRKGISVQGEQCTPVVQYTLEGEYITEFVSIRDASRELEITHHLIKKVCDKHKDHKQTGGYLFRYKGDSDINYDRKSYEVLQLSLDNKIIAEYATQKEASKTTGVNYSGIGACCRGEQKTSGGYIWKYKEN